MAADAITVGAGGPWGSVHNTLTSTTADTITITCGEPCWIEVVNRSTTQALWVEVTDTAVAAADGTAYLPPAASSGPPSIDGPIAADFNSELSGPTGYTDAYGNVWTIS